MTTLAPTLRDLIIAADVLRTARDQGIEPIPDGDQLRCRGPREALTAVLLEEIKRYKLGLRELVATRPPAYPCLHCQRFAFRHPETFCFGCGATPTGRA